MEVVFWSGIGLALLSYSIAILAPKRTRTEEFIATALWGFGALLSIACGLIYTIST